MNESVDNRMRFLQGKNLNAKMLQKYSLQIDITLSVVNINFSTSESQFTKPTFHLYKKEKMLFWKVNLRLAEYLLAGYLATYYHLEPLKHLSFFVFEEQK